MKWAFLVLFGGCGLGIMLYGVFGGLNWGLALFGLVFLLAGIGSFYGIGSIDKTFEKAFFMADKFGDKTGRMGNFYRGQATVKTVDVQNLDGSVAVGVTCELLEGDTGLRRTFVCRPTTYEINGQRVSEAQAQAWQGRPVWVIYNTQDSNDYHLDIMALLGSDRSSRMAGRLG